MIGTGDVMGRTRVYALRPTCLRCGGVTPRRWRSLRVVCDRCTQTQRAGPDRQQDGRFVRGGCGTRCVPWCVRSRENAARSEIGRAHV